MTKNAAEAAHSRGDDRGEIVIAYGTGFGATSPAVPSGTVSPASPAAQTVLPVRASLNGGTGAVNAPVEFAGLTPGYVGLYQVNIRVPADAPTGPTVELTIEQDGVTSAPVTLPVTFTSTNVRASVAVVNANRFPELV